MIPVEQAIFDALKGLVANRCYPDTFTQPSGGLPTWPAIRYSLIGGEVDADLCGDGEPATDSARVQLDVVAPTAMARATLVAQVRTAMATLSLVTPAPPDAVQIAVLQGAPITLFDDETKTYRAVLEYAVHGSSD